MSDDEINDLGINNISRNKPENNIKVYIHMNEEQISTYLYKKAALAQNRWIQIRPFIPPQLYQRYVYLSRNLYIARKSDNTLKTLVTIAYQDLSLRIKIKNPENSEEHTEWENIDNLTKIWSH